jgi:hypothetical protein
MDGWLSRDGYFYADESIARSSGATHTPCVDCGVPAKRPWVRCPDCIEKHDAARFAARPRKPWDGTAMLYSDSLDRYFSDPMDAQCEAIDEDIDDPRLIICEPVYARPIELDYFQDELPEDSEDLPPEIEAAMDAFNAAVAGIILAWLPGKFALDLEGSE